MAKTKKSDAATYTKPALRDRIKDKVVASDKGGDAGQWSARKAQFVTQEYEREGGGFKKPRNQAQKSLAKWGDEKWTTADGKNARRPGGTTRYLPAEAWEKLSSEEKTRTNVKKQKGSVAGKQFVANTPAVSKARKQAAKKKRPAAKRAATKGK